MMHIGTSNFAIEVLFRLMLAGYPLGQPIPQKWTHRDAFRRSGHGAQIKHTGPDGQARPRRG